MIRRMNVSKCAAIAVVLAIAMTGTVRRAAAQDSRERTSLLLEDAERRLGETTDEESRRELQRRIELYKHRLGYRDFDDRVLSWSVSYQKRLLKTLDDEIARMESATKGGWGLAAKGEDAKRAVRIVARHLLQRSDQEPDETERSRYAVAGMLLVHNADVLDPMMGAVEQMLQARRAAGGSGDTETVEAGLLRRAVAGADSLIAMARQVADRRLTMGHGELGRLARDLDRLRIGADYVLDGKLPPPAPEGPSDEDRRNQECDHLARRAAALATAQPQIAAQLANYVEQARFGLAVERVRPVAEAILANVRTAVELTESLTTGKTGSATYRRAMLDRLAAAVAAIDRPDRREEAYRTIQQINNDDRQRRNFDLMPVADATKADLWLGMEWIQSQMSKPLEDPVRQEAERLRDPLQRLWWRTRDLHAARQPQNTHFRTPFLRGLKLLETVLGQLGREMRSPATGSDQKCQRVDALIGDLHLVRNAGCGLDDLAPSMMPSAQIRTVGQQAAQVLCDDNFDNDGPARPVVRAMSDAFRLLAEFYGTAIPRDSLAEVNLLTRGRHAATFKKQASKSESLIKGLVENDRQEYNVLRETMPLYRMTAAAVVLGASGAPAADADRLRAARHLTADPTLVRQIMQPAAERLPDVFFQLTRITAAELAPTVLPVARAEQIVRPSAAALVELRRDSDTTARLAATIDALQATSRGDPGSNIRDRWFTSWHLNQAIEAYLAGYEETGDFHGEQLRYRNPLLAVRLGAP